jgi:hydrophobe/amphiphile efflux-1 (HAE1) family protein
VLASFGFSLNNLTLFGLVLAIGIVVDDAIVVVENVERYLSEGMSPRDAAHKTMDEVGGALIAIALVLCAVFIPTAFITGISGAFYRQFALTIASATVISCIISLTLSPALAALLLRTHANEQVKSGFWARASRPLNAFFAGFNRMFEKLSSGYAGLTRRVIRIVALMLVVYAGLIDLTYFQFARTPSGFIPSLDRAYFIVAVTLPPGSSLQRTDAVIRKASEILLSRPGVAHTVTFAGFDGATFTNAPNSGVLFVPLKPFEERVKEKLTAEGILNDLRGQLQALREASVLVIQPPSVPGIGTGGGFKLYVQDRAGRGARALTQAVGGLTAQANQTPGLTQVFTLFNASTSQVYADIDRTKAEMLGVPISRFFDTLSTYMGSTFVNDFNILGRTYRVTAQADNPYRLSIRDVEALRTRSNSSDMVPLGAVARFRDVTGPYRVPRYNLYPAAEVQGATLPGFSTGQAIAAMERILGNLPSGFGFEWTEIALQEKTAGNTAVIAFSLAVVFVFLLLAAQYESTLLPLAVILIVPMCLLAAISGVLLRGMDNNILTQIGFAVLIGLAAKNAILIVEFAKQAEDQGADRWEAAVQAARTRLRPILMTSLAFILGVVPLVIATGAGAELHQALGTAVFFGMLGVTLFGLLFTPVFYVLVRWIGSKALGRAS